MKLTAEQLREKVAQGKIARKQDILLYEELNNLKAEVEDKLKLIEEALKTDKIFKDLFYTARGMKENDGAIGELAEYVKKDEKFVKGITGKDGETPIVDYPAIIKEVMANVRQPEDGKDAVVDYEKITKDVLAKIPPVIEPKIDEIIASASKQALDGVLPLIPTIEAIEADLPRLGDKFRDGLELLKGSERLTKDAILGLDDYEEVSRLARQPKTGGGGGSTARYFYQLYDAPQTYGGQAGKGLRVKSTEDALEFYTISSSGVVFSVNGSPTSDQTDINFKAGTNITFADDQNGTITISASGGSGSGTVTGVEVASANGFAGTVSSSTTTPVITLSTTITSPVLAGNGTAISAGVTTGTGSTVVLATSPTLVTPNIGTATATRIKIGTADGTAFVDVQGVTTVAQGMRMEGNSADALAFTSYVTGDGQLRFIFQNDGKLLWGSGSAVADTNLYRSAANVLKTDDTLSVVGNVNLPSLNASQLVSTNSNKDLQSLPTGAYPSLTEIGYVKGVTSTIQTQLNNLAVNSITFLLDGGGTGITSGIKGDLSIPYACTINSVTMLADQTGTLVVDIWKDTYANYPATVLDSITASAKATISATNKSVDTTLTGWTTSIAAGDTLRFNVDAAYTITRATIALKTTII